MSITAKEYRELDHERLAVKISHLKRDLRLWQEAVNNGKEKNHAKLVFLKKEIARVMTILREKELAASKK